MQFGFYLQKIYKIFFDHKLAASLRLKFTNETTFLFLSYPSTRPKEPPTKQLDFIVREEQSDDN